MLNELKFQIGKNGVTDGVVETLRLAFDRYKQIRIAVLKGAVRDRTVVKEMAEALTSKLKSKEHVFTYKIIGFTILLRRRGNSG